MQFSNHIKAFFSAAVILLFAASCRAPRDITYIQNLEPGQSISVAPMRDITAMPGDRISIIVHSKDPQLAAMFNLNVSRPSQNGSYRNMSNSNSNNYSGQTAAYTVDNFGDIEFPILGTLHIGGMTRQQIAALIRNELISHELLKDPTVTVEFLDHSFTALGSVSHPGQIYFDRDHLTLVEAIGLAGDLQMNGMRKNVKVVRMENGVEKAYEVDLTDANSLYQSPVFYILPNDLIYVEPNNTSKRNTTPNGNSLLTPSFWMSITSFAISIATFIILR